MKPTLLKHQFARGKWIPLGPSPEPEQGGYVNTARAERGHAKGEKAIKKTTKSLRWA
jgi:hypothetical protein